jgi:hypothetical protein
VTPYQGTPTEHARVWAAEGVPRPVNPKPFDTSGAWRLMHNRGMDTRATNIPRVRGNTDPDFAKEWGG